MGWWRALLLAASLSATSAWSSESESPIHWGRDLAAGLAQAAWSDSVFWPSARWPSGKAPTKK